jgi:hypothetical protein
MFWGQLEGPLFMELESSDSQGTNLGWLKPGILTMNEIHQIIIF